MGAVREATPAPPPILPPHRPVPVSCSPRTLTLQVWNPAVGSGALSEQEQAVSGLSSWEDDSMAPRAPMVFDSVRVPSLWCESGMAVVGLPLAPFLHLVGDC